MTRDGRNRGRVHPFVPSAIGVLLLLVVVGEWAVFADFRIDRILSPANLASLAASLPFVFGLIYGGYWLHRCRLSSDRYGRVVGWCVGGLVVFVAMNSLSIVSLSLADPWFVVGWLRWAAAIGAGIGLLTGVIEARAIDREIAAERSRVRNRELQRQNDRLEEFASVITHDLRNPLNVASGRIEIARSESTSESLGAAARALERMEQIIERTLTLARSGLVVDDREPVDLGELAFDSWQNVATHDAGLRIEDAPIVHGDPDRLRHVLENLFRNAVEHSSTSPRSSSSREDAVEHGGHDVTVRVGSLEDGFFVEDDGPGIPEDERSSVFEAGYTSISDGTGFGLSIVRQIVDAHGWTVAPTESETGGARFEVTGIEVGPDVDRPSVEEPPVR